jgi:hypothetical protein
MVFRLGTTILFSAATAGAVLVMDERAFAGFEHFAGLSEFISIRCKDDALDGVIFVGLDERGFAEGEAAGAQHAGVGGGSALIDAALVEGLHDEEVVELDGGAVLGEGEGYEVGKVIGIAAAVAGEFPDAGVVVAEERVLDGGRVTAISIGLDAAADFVHEFLENFCIGILIPKGLRTVAELRSC